MNQNTGKRKNTTSTISYGLSKPSKQSLVARGLAANEDKARKRLQEQAHIPQMTPKPGYIFYNSSDSDQVYSTNKRLDRCNSLLKKLTKDDDRPLATKASKAKSQKKESKKIVKIILPNPMMKPGVSGQNKGTINQKGKVVTSTPNLKKRAGATKRKEEELLKELSRMEMEKNELQEQYSSLLQQHLTTSGSKLESSFDSRHENFDVHMSKENRAEPRIFPKNQTPSKPLQSSLLQNSSSSMTSSSVFQELERKIAGISEKLSFPRPQTPRINRHNVKQTAGDFSLSTSGLSYKTRDSTIKSEGEKDSFIPRDSPHMVSNGSKEFFPLWPSAQPNTPHKPLHGLHSSVSLEEATYRSSLSSESDCEKTMLADDVNSLYTSTTSSCESDFVQRIEDRHSKADVVETSLVESSEQEVPHPRAESIIKTVRFEPVPSHDFDESEDISSCEEGDNYTMKNSLDYETYHPVKEVSEIGSDDVKLRGEGKTPPIASQILPQKNKRPKSSARMTPGKGKGSKRGKTIEDCDIKDNASKEIKSQPENVQLNAKKAKSKTEGTSKQQFYESPSRFETKSSMDVVSQLSHMKEPGNTHLRQSPNGSGYVEGIKPGLAATQITALNYLFRELRKLLSDRFGSEEDRLLTEIDHMIGVMPFLISNLQPDLQTEISLAVQPLRVENSDLRRQLRIANQKSRDLKANTRNLEMSLKEAEKRAVGTTQLEKLKTQINQDEAERRILKERISEINKTIEEIRGENQKLVQQIIDKDSEMLKQKQLWQKEKSSIHAEHEVAKNKLESMSLALQAQEKQNRILQLSLSQSEAEIVRLKELNKDLRDSVAKLLRDLNYRESREPAIQQKSSPLEKQHPGSVFKKPHILRNSLDEFNHVPKNIDQYREVNSKVTWHHGTGRDGPESFYSLSDQNGEISSISSVSDLTPRNELVSAGQSLIFSDQFSTLTCDSGEFRSNLANLSTKIRTMQESLHNAKRT